MNLIYIFTFFKFTSRVADNSLYKAHFSHLVHRMTFSDD